MLEICINFLDDYDKGIEVVVYISIFYVLQSCQGCIFMMNTLNYLKEAAAKAMMIWKVAAKLHNAPLKTLATKTKLASTTSPIVSQGNQHTERQKKTL